jgi:ATP-dependent Clp protease protease subunit
MRNQLMALFAKNRGKGKGLKSLVTAAAASATPVTTIYIYDVICGTDEEAEWLGGIGPESFARALVAGGPSVLLRINSPGGDVFGGRAMATAITAAALRGQSITASVDGMAASAATLLVTACPQAVMAQGAMMMIHNAWTIEMGDRNDFAATAALLGKIDAELAATYAARAAHRGMSGADFAAMMDAETWLTGTDAIALGLVDAIETLAPAEAPVPPAAEDEGDDAGAEGEPPEPGELEPGDASARIEWDLTAYGQRSIEAARRTAPPAPATPGLSAEDELDHRIRQAAAALI